MRKLILYYSLFILRLVIGTRNFDGTVTDGEDDSKQEVGKNREDDYAEVSAWLSSHTQAPTNVKSAKYTVTHNEQGHTVFIIPQDQDDTEVPSYVPTSIPSIVPPAPEKPSTTKAKVKDRKTNVPINVNSANISHKYDYSTMIDDPHLPKKSKYKNPLSDRLECIQTIQNDIYFVFKEFLRGERVIGYADPAANENLGDQLLWAGSNRLFLKFGKSPVLYCGGSQSKHLEAPCEGPEMKQKIHEVLGGGKGVMWYNPGGNWCVGLTYNI